jgi:hypothetical protein
MGKETKTHTIQELPDGLTPKARKQRHNYQQRYEQRLEKMLMAVSLDVLVWGPAVNLDTPLAVKRRDIHNELKRIGHNAMFSEEIKGTKKTLPTLEENYPLSLRELAQAIDAHYIIILLDRTTQGATSELDICTRRDIAAKVFVMVHKDCEEGYTHLGAIKMIEGGNGAIYWYTDVELETCNVLTMAIQRVELRRSQYAYNKAMREGSHP